MLPTREPSVRLFFALRRSLSLKGILALRVQSCLQASLAQLGLGNVAVGLADLLGWMEAGDLETMAHDFQEALATDIRFVADASANGDYHRACRARRAPRPGDAIRE